MEAVTLAALVGSAAIAGAYVGGALLPWPGLHEALVPGSVWGCEPDSVALTFDDGPDPTATPVLLDVLRGAGATATFFLVGERALAFPELVRRIADEGHAIGNHGWQHLSLPALGARRMSLEIDRCQSVLTALVGTPPRLLRPPYGRRDFRVLLAARRRGLTPVMWSFDSRDWLAHDDGGLTHRLGRVRRSDIVLLHDGLARRTAMIAALGTLLARLAHEGIPTVRLDSEGKKHR